jgi:TPR repeat protein
MLAACAWVCVMAPVASAKETAKSAAKGRGGLAALAAGDVRPAGLEPTAEPEALALEVKAKRGDATAQAALADLLLQLSPTPPEQLRRAVYWHGQAARQGLAASARVLGDIFQGGIIPPPDMEQAAFWYERAARDGDVQAAFDLGLLLTRIGAPAYDPQAARVWLVRAAGAGVAAACYRLGLLYEQGIDGPPDLAAAQEWYRQGSEQGDPQARQALTRLTEGQGDLVFAHHPPPGMRGGPPGALEPPRQTADGAARLPPALIKDIQSALRRLGYYRGKGGGALDRRTTEAIRAYQKARGLPATGVANTVLLERLRADAG